MSIHDKCKTYFKLFSKKDLKGIKKMFSYDVKLKDWEIEKKVSIVFWRQIKVFLKMLIA